MEVLKTVNIVIFLFKFACQHRPWQRFWTAFWSPKKKAGKHEQKAIAIRGK